VASAQRLNWALPGDPSTLDAARIGGLDDSGLQITAQIYDTLVRFQPGTTQLSPGLALDWQVNEDATIWTFALRQGVRFHDGQPLDAEAAAWNFRRWLDPQHVAHKGEFVYWKQFMGGFAGERDSEGRPLGLFDRVEAVDRFTLRIRLRLPFAPLLNLLALPPFGLASPSAVLRQGEKYGSDANHAPVGSGPFRFEGWRQGHSVTLEAVREHWAGRPLVAKLVFNSISDPARRFEALRDGLVLVAQAPAASDLAEVDGDHIRVVYRPHSATAWLNIHLGRPPLDDLRVRQAISQSIHRAQIARDHFGPRALVANQAVPPGFLGHHAGLRRDELDPSGARQTLTEVGLGSGFSVDVWAPNSPRPWLPDPTGTAQAIANDLKAIGIDAHVRTATLHQYLLDAEAGRYPLWLGGWQGQTGDPDTFYFFHFGSVLAREGGYDNPDVRALVTQAQETVATGRRAELYQRAALLIQNDVPKVFLAHTSEPLLVSARLRDLRPSPLRFDQLSSVWVAPGGRPPTRTPSPTITSTPVVSPTVALTATSTPQAVLASHETRHGSSASWATVGAAY
jgi:peptide/nickel transport system substrate-binding protein